MALNIKDETVDRLARELARRKGVSITQALNFSLNETLATLRGRPSGRASLEELNEIALRCAALPRLDTRTPDEIIGYDEHGLPR